MLLLLQHWELCCAVCIESRDIVIRHSLALCNYSAKYSLLLLLLYLRASVYRLLSLCLGFDRGNIPWKKRRGDPFSTIRRTTPHPWRQLRFGQDDKSAHNSDVTQFNLASKFFFPGIRGGGDCGDGLGKEDFHWRSLARVDDAGSTNDDGGNLRQIKWKTECVRERGVLSKLNYCTRHLCK